MRVWDQLSANFGDFRARAGADWHRNEWDFRFVATGPAKVHLDVQFTSYRIDNSVIGSYRSCGSSLTPAEIEQWRHDELRGLICIIFSLSATEDAGETGDSVYLETQAKAEPTESVVMTTTTRGCCKTV